MTLAEAIADIERRFIVHQEAGLPITHWDQHDKPTETGARDMSKAPCGEPYVTVTSSSDMKSGGEANGILFGSEDAAIRWWNWAVLDYAETVAGEGDWAKLHLYWREPPRLEQASYIAMQQASLTARASPMTLGMELYTVLSRLLITKLRPDGTEEEA